MRVVYDFPDPVPKLIFEPGRLTGFTTMPPRMPSGTYLIDWTHGPNVASLYRVEPREGDVIRRYPSVAVSNGASA
jgi:hypothetical protein